MRCAVSMAPRFSTRRKAERISGAVTSVMGRLPIQGKIFCSRRIKSRSPWSFVHLGVNFACHSRAIASKLFSAASFFERLMEFLRIPGSMLLVSCLRASSRASLASASETVGYDPSASFFSIPANRYFNFQSFDPFGLTRRYKPLPSANL
jgi:hypothetical protein